VRVLVLPDPHADPAGLATARPDAFTPDLATALNTQSNALAALGRTERWRPKEPSQGPIG